MKIVIKVILAAILFGCLLKMPYGYYQFVRIAATIGFAWLCYNEFENKKPITGILCLGAAILLNPIIKVSFKKGTWNDIDTVLGIALIVWAIADLITIKKK